MRPLGGIIIGAAAIAAIAAVVGGSSSVKIGKCEWSDDVGSSHVAELGKMISGFNNAVERCNEAFKKANDIEVAVPRSHGIEVSNIMQNYQRAISS